MRCVSLVHELRPRFVSLLVALGDRGGVPSAGMGLENAFQSIVLLLRHCALRAVSYVHDATIELMRQDDLRI